MPNITGHAILKIVKGVMKTPGDTSSAEAGLDEIDLLDPNGFSCDEYDMKIPALKSSAVYADSPLTDGRILISGTLGNVTETIRLQLTAGTIIQLAAMLSKLGRFKQDCNDFWDTFGQIEPIYIKHQIDGEPGPRFALLYDIDVDVDTPLVPSEAKRTVTLVIERETYWRGLAPGDNPKKWTVENFFVGQKWDSADADLLTGSNHLFDETIQSRQEWNVGQTALLSKNYIDIPATSIPGDAPALIQLFIQQTVQPSIGVNRVTIGKTSKPDLLSSGVVRKPNYVLNGVDGNGGTDSAIQADTGAPKQSSSGINRRLAVTFATVTAEANRISWYSSIPGYFDLSTLRGRYMVFLRARLSAASTVTLRLLVSDFAGTVYTSLASLTDIASGGTGDTTYWAVLYMGVLAFPINNQKIIVGNDGLGVEVATASVTPSLSLLAARTGAATNLYVADLTLIPIDEGSWSIQGQDLLGSNQGMVFDNTGYYLHGQTGEYMSVDSSPAADVRSTDFVLTPKQRNRLILFADVANPSSVSAIDSAFRVRGNIIPRWSGLRDV